MTEVKRNQTSQHKPSPFYKRIAIIDFLRGFLILLVVFDHLMYCIHDFGQSYFNILGIHEGPWYDAFYKVFLQPGTRYFDQLARNLIREVALSMFLLLSGVSVAFSKNNEKRAVKMVSFALGLSVVSNLLQGFSNNMNLGFNTLVINFNVVAVVATCVLFYCLVEKKSNRFMFWMVFMMIVFTYILEPVLYQELKHSGIIVWPLWPSGSITINGVNYYAADHMALFPYMLFFFIGVMISRVVYRCPKDHLSKNKEWMKPLCFCGRHSLLIYALHQVILCVLFMSIGAIIQASVGG